MGWFGYDSSAHMRSMIPLMRLKFNVYGTEND